MSRIGEVCLLAMDGLWALPCISFRDVPLDDFAEVSNTALTIVVVLELL